MMNARAIAPSPAATATTASSPVAGRAVFLAFLTFFVGLAGSGRGCGSGSVSSGVGCGCGPGLGSGVGVGVVGVSGSVGLLSPLPFPPLSWLTN